MKRILKFLLTLLAGCVVLFLVGAVIHAAMARSFAYLFLTAGSLTVAVIVARWIRRRRIHREMADTILDPEEMDLRLPAPVNGLEREVSEAIRVNRELHRARRAERHARWRNSDSVIRLVGYPKY